MSKSNSYTWPDNVFFETEADKDFAKLDHSQQLVVFKAIKKSLPIPDPRRMDTANLFQEI